MSSQKEIHQHFEAKIREPNPNQESQWHIYHKISEKFHICGKVLSLNKGMDPPPTMNRQNSPTVIP